MEDACKLDVCAMLNKVFVSMKQHHAMLGYRYVFQTIASKWEKMYVSIYIGIRPVKTEWWDACMVVCLGKGAADAIATHCLLLQ